MILPTWASIAQHVVPVGVTSVGCADSPSSEPNSPRLIMLPGGLSGGRTTSSAVSRPGGTARRPYPRRDAAGAGRRSLLPDDPRARTRLTRVTGRPIRVREPSVAATRTSLESSPSGSRVIRHVANDPCPLDGEPTSATASPITSSIVTPSSLAMARTRSAEGRCPSHLSSSQIKALVQPTASATCCKVRPLASRKRRRRIPKAEACTARRR